MAYNPIETLKSIKAAGLTQKPISYPNTIAQSIGSGNYGGVGTNQAIPNNTIAQQIAQPTTKGAYNSGTEAQSIANNIAQPKIAAPVVAPTVAPQTNTLVRPTSAPVQKAVDNSGMINEQYGNIVSALKAQIAQSINNKNLAVQGLGQKYQGDKNASEVAKYGQVNSLNEIAANQGDRGGIGRQNTLAAMVGGENRLNDINLQQGSEEASLKNDIANLVLEGNIQEATIQSNRLKDLIANNTNMDNTNYERNYNAEGRALQNYQFDVGQGNTDRQFNQGVTEFNTNRGDTLSRDKQTQENFNTNRGDTLAQNTLENTRIANKDKIEAETKMKSDYAASIKGLGDQMDYQAEINAIVNDGDTSNDWKLSILKQERQIKVDNKLQNDIQTINQYGTDFQAEINKRAPNDPLVPYLKVARANKLSTIAASQLSQEEQIQKSAIEMFKATGTASGWVAEALGVPEGSQSVEFKKALDSSSQQWAQIGIQQQNANTSAYKAANSGSGGSGGSVNTKTATSNYEGYKDTFAKSNGVDSKTGQSTWEKAASDIIFGSDAKEKLGNNYDTAVKAANKAYYNQVNDGWDDREAMQKELSNNEMLTDGLTYAEYYKQMLGDSNYKKLMDE